MDQEFIKGSITPFIPIDWKQFETRVTKLIKLEKRLLPTNKIDHISTIFHGTDASQMQREWWNKVNWNEIFIIDQMDEIDYNPGQNILRKVKKSSKIGQDFKNLLSKFACFLTAIAKV